MAECDKVNLLKVEGQYLKFIVENQAELNVLEHIEKCRACREQILDTVKKDAPLPDYGNLFQREFKDQSIPQYSDYKKAENFIDARIQWRKRKLKELVEEAELELKDLGTRI